MANLTERMSASQWLEAQKSPGKSRVAAGFRGGLAARRMKFGNQPSTNEAGCRFDSVKERRHHDLLLQLMGAADPEDRVVKIEMQQRFLLVEASPPERAVHYVADFVVTYGDGRIEVQDVKSPPTRKNPAYIIKRKLMLSVHGIRIREF